MTEHTKGPWFVDDDGNVQSSGRVVRRTDWPIRVDADTANARLIASAPDLLEALEPFARMAAAYDPDEGDDDHEAWAFNARPTIGQLRKARAASGHEIVSKGERS